MLWKTEKLYLESAYIKDFEACVCRCSAYGADGGLYAVILDRTAFFPESGGQYGDSGYIGGVRVTDTVIENGNILHITEAPLSEGEHTFCTIDFEQRFVRMQNHTGEHIVSGIIHRLFGYNNVGFHLGDDVVTLDTDGILSDEDIAGVELCANKAVWSNATITATFVTADMTEIAPFRGHLERISPDEPLRIVDMDGIDRCACCAPHVAATGEVGMIKIIDRMRYKGGMRLSIVCGALALSDYASRQSRERLISTKLSLPIENGVEGVDRLIAENALLKSKISKLNMSIRDSLLASIPEGERCICIFTELDTVNTRQLINMALEKCETCAIFNSTDGMGYNFIIGSVSTDMRQLAKGMFERFSGKGGGSSKMIQGTVTAMADELSDYVKHFVGE